MLSTPPDNAKAKDGVYAGKRERTPLRWKRSVLVTGGMRGGEVKSLGEAHASNVLLNCVKHCSRERWNKYQLLSLSVVACHMLNPL